MTRPRIDYQPGLDGIRGLSVAGIVLFHSELSWAQGGFLGVSTFFTLSGYLITTLLLVEHGASGRIALGRFWGRRVRRLMPASLAGVVLAIAFTAAAGSDPQLAQLRGDALSVLFYVANWRFVWSQHAYASLFQEPSPLLHFWSLAIEEQFYAIFPSLVAGVLGVAAGSRRALGGAMGLLAAASLAATLALLGADATADRIYFGTDTRAAEFAIGGVLAVWLHRGRAARSVAVDVLGMGALAACLVAWWGVGLESTPLYQGGLPAYALLSAALIAAAVQPAGAVRALLSVGPLRQLGRISYGVYVYHWPVFLWLDAERTGLGAAPLFGLRAAVVLALSLVSYRALELPIRRGQLTGWRAFSVGAAATLGVVGALLAVTSDAPTTPLDLTSDPVLALRDSPAPPPASGDGHPRVAVFGDSTALVLSRGLFVWLHATGSGTPVRGVTSMGCGIADRGVFRVRGKTHTTKLGCGRVVERWARAADERRADLAVVLLGHWDLHDRRLPQDRTWRGPGDPVFDAYLRSEMLDVVDRLSGSGARVAWLTMPEVAPKKWEAERIADLLRRIARFNELLREAEALRPQELRVIDLAGYLNGLGSARLDGVMPDGVHLDPIAARRLSERWLGPALLALAAKEAG